MNVEIQYRLRSNPNDIKYLREKSYWYKFLNRNKNYFKQFEEEMKKEYKLTPEDKIRMCIKHYKLAIKNDGEYKAVREMRKHASWYIKGLPKCTEIRGTMNKIDNSEDVLNLLDEYAKFLKELSN